MIDGGKGDARRTVRMDALLRKMVMWRVEWGRSDGSVQYGMWALGQGGQGQGTGTEAGRTEDRERRGECVRKE